jgi:hypothetical protein
LELLMDGMVIGWIEIVTLEDFSPSTLVRRCGVQFVYLVTFARRMERMVIGRANIVIFQHFLHTAIISRYGQSIRPEHF